MGRILRTTENTRRHKTIDNSEQSRLGLDEDSEPLESGSLELLGRSDAPDVGVLADARDGEDIHGYTDDGNQRRVHGRVKKK